MVIKSIFRDVEHLPSVRGIKKLTLYVEDVGE